MPKSNARLFTTYPLWPTSLFALSSHSRAGQENNREGMRGNGAIRGS